MSLKQFSTRSLVLVTMCLLGCGTTERDWKAAKELNTASTYADFIAKHPKSPHVDDARAAMDYLDWSSAKLQNTTSGYTKYLTCHPSGRHIAEATAAFEDLTTYVSLGLPCGGRFTLVRETAGGSTSGDIVDFECIDKEKKMVKLKLKANNFTDGKLETEDFGTILMEAHGMGANYEILAGQRKKLQALLGYGEVAESSSEPPIRR